MKVGDYVRTEYGISKIVAFYSNAIFNDKNKRIENNLIIKSSPNIIDLIEEYDYIKLDGWGNIKFWRVVKAPYGKLMIEDDGWNELEDFENEKIIGIITHEQIEAMEYKIGE